MFAPFKILRQTRVEMRAKISRRQLLLRTGQTALASAIGFPFLSLGEPKAIPARKFGSVAGNAIGAQAGEQILAEGGNAIDAAVAAALAASVASPHLCGIGGYGGHMILAKAGGKHIDCIDFNTAAPAAARADMFPVNDAGEVSNKINCYGWLASGVPGVLAGLQMALDQHGTRRFGAVAKPAIDLARGGITVDAAVAKAITNAAPRLAKDPGSAKLYLTQGRPPEVGERLRNPDLAELLSTLAQRNSTRSFYEADIAQRIADAFQKGGGLVTMRDLADYRARKVEPLRWAGQGFEVYTAPLGAGGLTVLQAVSVLDAMNWNGGDSSAIKTHALVEAIRLVWKDRLECFGDPASVHVPVEKLLSIEYASSLAQRAQAAAHSGKAMELKIETSRAPGTVNISSVDRRGNVVAVTLTHGGDFGAQVTVDGLGLTLGQGMYKFNPRPASPNAPGPGKRPVHNMCPSLVIGPNKSMLAVGGAGSQVIPNALLSFLISYVFKKTSMPEALAAPRLHTIGTLDVTVEDSWRKADLEYLTAAGFNVKVAPCAHLSAASFDGATGDLSAAMR